MARKAYGRAWFAGVALILVGAHLSVIMGAYLIPPAGTYHLLNERWFWDLSFYLQLFCISLVSIFHLDRLHALDGWRRTRAKWRFLVAILGVSPPGIAVLTLALGGWINESPPRSAILMFANTMFVLWVALDYLLPMVLRHIANRQRTPPRRQYSPLAQTVLLMPLLLLAGLTVENLINGREYYLVVWPFLLYLHRAIAYFHLGVSGQSSEPLAFTGLPADD